ncbi:RHS repeat-associated core domain-containing protein [Mucilaginibacter sp. OK098]|nr:RHS repeat-associated core domain-containing protein [Mucilaginibacter sp. OK098]
MLSCFVLLLAQQAKAQQPGFVQDEIIKVPNITSDGQVYGLTTVQKQTVISYYDGLGRPIQTVALQASPAGNDLIQPAAYDNLGRQTTGYLPYAGKSTDATGSYRPNAISTDQTAFYSSAGQPLNLVATDGIPYNQQVFENSPLQRLLSTGMVGTGFQPGVGGNHWKTVSYRPNTSADGNILIWGLNGTYTGSSYTANSLSVTDGKDEDGVETFVFTDLEGHTILKRQIHSGGNLDTYYIYNAAGMVSYVIPPKAVALLVTNNYNLATAPLMNIVFHYTYDARARVISRTVPAQGVMYIVYDNWNRPVLMQNAKLKENNRWNYIKYDAKGRVISQGIYADGTHLGQSAMQTYVNGFTTIWYESRNGSPINGGYYTNNAFPTTGTALSFAYYDDYDLTLDGVPDFNYATQSDPNLPNEESATAAALRGVPTMVSKASVGNGLTGVWITRAFFYDKRGSLIQELSNNQVFYSAAYTLTDAKTIVNDFTGVPQATKVLKKSSASVTTTVYTAFTYDAMNRVTQVSQKYNAGTMQPVAAYTYNEIGQVIKKGLGYVSAAAIPATQSLNTTYSGTNTILATSSISMNPGFSVPLGSTFTAQIVTNYLQSVNYRYNIRGQLLTINNSTLTNDMSTNRTNDDTNDVFGMELLYDQQDAGLLNAPRFNGKLTGVKWMSKDGSGIATKERSYKFTYNDLDQYTAENYGERAAAGIGSFSNNAGGFDEYGIVYDAGGDISHLNRNTSTVNGGAVSTIDNLSYTYSTTIPNQLLSVADAGTTAGFSGGTGNYLYDGNGNLTTDPYKHLSIGYDDLNRTDKITITNATNRYIDYTYNANGTLLRKRQYDNGALQHTTDYVDGFVFIDNILSYFAIPEGRVLNNSSTLVQEFVITDQQGNARVSFQNNGSNAAVVKQENSYYGFGMSMASAMALPTTPNKQLYNGGSEWQNDFSNLPDYQQTFYRNYDAALARFVGVDPMAEGAENLSVYHYAGNNPIMNNDPMGNQSPLQSNAAFVDMVTRELHGVTNPFETIDEMGNGSSNSGGGGGGFIGAILGATLDYLNQNTTVNVTLNRFSIAGLDNQYQQNGDNGRIASAIAGNDLLNWGTANLDANTVTGGYYHLSDGSPTTVNGVSGSFMATNFSGGANEKGESWHGVSGSWDTETTTDLSSKSWIASVASTQSGLIGEILAPGAKVGYWAQRAQAIKNYRILTKTGRVLGAASVLATIVEDSNRPQGFTKGTFVKSTIGTLGVIFPEFGLVYGVVDLGFTIFSNRSLTDRIGDAVDNIR